MWPGCCRVNSPTSSPIAAVQTVQFLGAEVKHDMYTPGFAGTAGGGGRGGGRGGGSGGGMSKKAGAVKGPPSAAKARRCGSGSTHCLPFVGTDVLHAVLLPLQCQILLK